MQHGIRQQPSQQLSKKEEQRARGSQKKKQHNYTPCTYTHICTVAAPDLPQHRDHEARHVRNQAGLGARVRVHLRVAARANHVRRLRPNRHHGGDDPGAGGADRLRRRRKRTGRLHAADGLRVAGRRRRWRHEAVRRRWAVFTHLRRRKWKIF